MVHTNHLLLVIWSKIKATHSISDSSLLMPPLSFPAIPPTHVTEKKLNEQINP